MRHIQKQGAPKALSDWKKHNRLAQQNLHYDNLGREQRQPMLQALLAEQHGLCAYTLRRIDLDCAHIEHVLPRSQHPDKTLDWANLLACFPGPQQGCAFGAKHKDAYDPARSPFVSPTEKKTEQLFRYHSTGEIAGLNDAAKHTASEAVLNLNHVSLVNDRRAKIQGALRQRPSAADARRRAERLRTPDANGQLEPYCVALAQVLEHYAQQLEARAARIKRESR